MISEIFCFPAAEFLIESEKLIAEGKKTNMILSPSGINL